MQARLHCILILSPPLPVESCGRTTGLGLPGPAADVDEGDSGAFNSGFELVMTQTSVLLLHSPWYTASPIGRAQLQSSLRSGKYHRLQGDTRNRHLLENLPCVIVSLASVISALPSHPRRSHGRSPTSTSSNHTRTRMEGTTRMRRCFGDGVETRQLSPPKSETTLAACELWTQIRSLRISLQASPLTPTLLAEPILPRTLKTPRTRSPKNPERCPQSP